MLTYLKIKSNIIQNFHKHFNSVYITWFNNNKKVLIMKSVSCKS